MQIVPAGEFTGRAVAHFIVRRVRGSVGGSRTFNIVISPEPFLTAVFDRLVELYNEGEVSFSNVALLTNIEIVGVSCDAKASFSSFIQQRFIKHVDFKTENLYLLRGNGSDPRRDCEQMLYHFLGRTGGVDLAVVAETNAISSRIKTIDGEAPTNATVTTFMTMVESVNLDATFAENGMGEAVRLGAGIMFMANHTLCLVGGRCNAQGVRRVIEGPVAADFPVSCLQIARRATVVLDEYGIACLPKTLLRSVIEKEGDFTDVLVFSIDDPRQEYEFYRRDDEREAKKHAPRALHTPERTPWAAAVSDSF